MRTAEEERANIVKFLRVMAEEVPPEQAEALDNSSKSKSEIARLTTERAADAIDAGMHDDWLAMHEALGAIFIKRG